MPGEVLAGLDSPGPSRESRARALLAMRPRPRDRPSQRHADGGRRPARRRHRVGLLAMRAVVRRAGARGPARDAGGGGGLGPDHPRDDHAGRCSLAIRRADQGDRPEDRRLRHATVGVRGRAGAGRDREDDRRLRPPHARGLPEGGRARRSGSSPSTTSSTASSWWTAGGRRLASARTVTWNSSFTRKGCWSTSARTARGDPHDLHRAPEAAARDGPASERASAVKDEDLRRLDVWA